MRTSDPIYGVIELQEEWLIELSNCQAIQRLKCIKQQGNTHYRIPSATHTRFSHILGVYHIMGEMIKNLDASEQQLPERERGIALASALLHDVGHGALSHCFEGITEEHHENRSVSIIRSEEEIGSLLSRKGILDDVAAVIGRTGKYPVIESLLFSQIGADKLDYLNRDLYYSGIGMPPIHYNKIINAITIVDNRPVIRDMEIIALLEHLLIVKRRLFKDTFAHPEVLGKDVLFQMLVKRAIHLGKLSFPFSNNNYLKMTDLTISEYIENWSGSDDAELARMCGHYLDRSNHSEMQWFPITKTQYQLMKEWSRTGVNPHYQVYRLDDSYGAYKKDIYVLYEQQIKELSIVSDISRSLASESISYFLFVFHYNNGNGKEQ
ncbi:HD domain-containing protein [Paenibacillus sp. UNCCL117]|uniref:HD domain-containing protein n=1 Tax=unclassified Paenibacillus TaxID=185978 RepID=UPI000881C386|nr:MULTISPECIES: HD domain-containing protein [unclassified Paenibacillus]SDE61472.1 HD domain-containing protein [Paenibacillus sp. cl123]SFW69757.1 HD domain-containing protein [Paenibacillus sp. UNCCL117]